MTVLREGSRGDDVRRLQLLLNSNVRPTPNLQPDGDFGKKTTAALMAFQRLRQLEADGVCGANTWAALGQKFLVVDKPVTNTGVKWMDIAAAEVGVHENSLPGQQNKRIIEYHAATSLAATEDEVPWCSSFVNWVMKQCGYKGTNNALAASWIDWGSPLQNPVRGAITVIRKKGASTDKATGSSTGNHVAFLESATATHLRLLGGNQGDSVKYSNFSLAAYEVRAYRWP